MNETKKMAFLTADDIDVRVGSKSKKGDRVSLLFYKDARVDMRYLDELFGAENWQADYKEIKGVMYCGIAVRASKIDNTLPTTEWVWKWNAGIESKGTGDDDDNNKKGEASDAFKRAGFLWNIGRELYNCKNVWVELNEDEIKGAFVSFSVKEIAFNENGLPSRIVIVDHRGNTRYTLGGKAEPPKKPIGDVLPPKADNPAPQQEKSDGGAKNDENGDVDANEKMVAARNTMIYTELLAATAHEIQAVLKCDAATAKANAKSTIHSFFATALSLGDNWSKKIELSRDPEDTQPHIKSRILVNFSDKDTEMKWNAEKNTNIRVFEMEMDGKKR